MSRIINVVSNDTHVYDLISNLVIELSKSKMVCLIDFGFGLNQIIYLFDEYPKNDLREFLIGEKNQNDVLNKVMHNLSIIKTNSMFFDYKAHKNEIKDLINKVSFDFEYIFLVGEVGDLEILDFRNLVSSEIFILIDNKLGSVMFAKKILKRAWKFKNLKNKKLLLNNHKTIKEIKGDMLSKEKIEDILKCEILYVKPKLLMGSLIQKRSLMQLVSAVENNKCVITNYKKKYLGVFGYFRRRLYEKFEQ